MHALGFLFVLFLLTGCASMSPAEWDAMQYRAECQARPYMCPPDGPYTAYQEIQARDWQTLRESQPGDYRRGAIDIRTLPSVTVTCETTSSGGRYYARSTTTCR